jgi:hypothetical protein
MTIDTTSQPRYHLTFDIDWAPDSCVEAVLSLLDRRGIKATFFITHESDIIADLVRHGHHVGIHPNFLPNSSHGSQPEHVIEHLLEFVPEATALRTHALVQSSPLFHRIFSAFPQLRHDLSLFMYGFPVVAPFEWHFGGCRFTRINYNWEDDAAFFDPGFDWATPRFHGPLTIYDFHPIHVALNSCDESNYGQLKASQAGKPLWTVAEKTLQAHVNHRPGARTFLQAVVDSTAQALRFEDLL